MQRFIYICLLLLTGSFSMSSMAMSNASKEEQTQVGVSEHRQSIEDSKNKIRDIKSKPPFVDIQQEKIWNIFPEEEQEQVNAEPGLEWLGELIGFIAMIIEAALWLLPFIALFYLYLYRDYWLGLIRGFDKPADAADLPETLFGLDMSSDSFPDDIEQHARQLWSKGQYREAVGLLYRASLRSLYKQFHFELSPGTTEQDCLHKFERSKADAPELSQLSADQLQHFQKLTRTWIKTAYAHRLPDESEFLAVCEGWNDLFTLDEASEDV